MAQRKPNPTGPVRSPYSMLGLGFEIVAPAMLLMYVGYRLDAWLNSQPWLFLLGALLGISIGFYNLFRRVQAHGQGEGEGKE